MPVLQGINALRVSQFFTSGGDNLAGEFIFSEAMAEGSHQKKAIAFGIAVDSGINLCALVRSGKPIFHSHGQ